MSYQPYSPPPPHPPTPGRPRRKVPVGLILGVVVVVAILLTKPEIVLQPLTSPLALAIILGIVAAFILVGFVLRRLRTPAPVRGAVLGVAALVVAYLLIWPFYRSDFFPPPAAAAAPPVMAEGRTAAEAVTGTIAGLDGHRGAGQASLLEVADGSYVVRLEGMDVQDGPDLRVYLVPGSSQEDPNAGAVELGTFGGSAGTRGDFNYQVPAGTEIESGSPYTVLIYCEPFAVPFAAATLS